jgi:hypothetical protein
MTDYLRLSICSFALSLLSGLAAAQPAAGVTSLPDTAVSRQANWNAIEVYHRYMGEESRLYNGIEHYGYLPFNNGHPYFAVDSMQNGSVRYENAWYRNVPLLYDIVRDELVTTNTVGDLVSLSGIKVNEFYLPGHHFINIANEYYDLLALGKIVLEARRIKKVEESIENLQVIRNIHVADRYDVVVNGERHSIGNLHALLAFMKDSKREVNQDLRRKKIKYRRTHEQALVEAVTYYNQIHPL